MLLRHSVIRTLLRSLRFVRNAIWPNVKVAAISSGIHVDWDVPVALRDGTVLRVNVFRPESSGPFPVLMSAHPYGKDKIPAKTRSGRGAPLQSRLLPQPHPVRISAYTSWEAPDPAVWVREGYAVVNADLRGGGTSEGVGDLFSDQEAHDYYDLIVGWNAGVVHWTSRPGWRFLFGDQPIQGGRAAASASCRDLPVGRFK
jgi:predicted acyl esterase